MDQGLIQRSALEANKIVGAAEGAKKDFFEPEELGDGQYDEIFQAFDVIKQDAEQYLDEIERKAEISLSGFEQYPVEEADSVNGYLDKISNSAELALYFNDPRYDDGLQGSREEALLEDIMDEVENISREVYGEQEESYAQMI